MKTSDEVSVPATARSVSCNSFHLTRAACPSSVNNCPTAAVLIFSLSIMLTPLVASADPFLNVDFNLGSSPTESGPPAFSAYNIVGTPASQAVGFSTSPTFTSGTTTITLSSSAGNLDSRDRGVPVDSGAFTFGELYEDFATTFDNNRTMQIQISGLLPSSLYSFTFYAFDEAVSSLSDTFTNTTSGTQPSTSGVISQSSTSISSNSQHALTMDAVADVSGLVTFTETPSAGTSPRLNGLQIAVPEPSAITLTISGLSLALLLRRKRLVR